MIRTVFRTHLAIAALALMTAVHAEDTYSLKRTITLDQVTKYKLSAQFELEGQKIELIVVTTEKITAKTDTGFSLESVQSDMMVKIDGNEIPADSGDKPETIKFLANGLPAEFATSVDENNARLSYLVALIAPDAPVKIGDKWTISAKNPIKAPALEYKGELVGKEKIGEIEALKVKMDVAEQSGKIPATSSSTYWLNPKDFSIIKGEGKVQKAPLSGLPEPADFSYSLELYADA